MNTDIKIGMAGKYKFEACKVDAAGNEIDGSRREILDGWVDNIITDSGLDLLSTQYPLYHIKQARVGSGNTAASATDTALVSEIATTTTIQATSVGVSGSSPHYGWVRRTFRFNTGIAAGNIAEVAIYGGSGNTVCLSRALIVDEFGDPITITILSDEVLDVIYEFRTYAPEVDVEYGPINISGTDYSGTIRASNVNITSVGTGGLPTNSGMWATDGQYVTFSGLIGYYSSNKCAAFETDTLGPITGSPAGSYSYATTITPEAYVNGTYYLNHEIFYDLNNGNLTTGIGAIHVQTSFGAFQMSVSPKFDKDNTKRLRLNVRISWERYAP